MRVQNKQTKGEDSMMIKLPSIIEAFVHGKNNHDSEAVVACFTNDAVVHDEGQEFRGTAAIKKWLDASIAKYKFTLTAKKLVDFDKETVLTAEVSGDFEGSPVPLDFHFTIREGKIDRLSILLAGK